MIRSADLNPNGAELVLEFGWARREELHAIAEGSLSEGGPSKPSQHPHAWLLRKRAQGTRRS
jgi:hypothetical protein